MRPNTLLSDFHCEAAIRPTCAVSTIPHEAAGCTDGDDGGFAAADLDLFRTFDWDYHCRMLAFPGRQFECDSRKHTTAALPRDHPRMCDSSTN